MPWDPTGGANDSGDWCPRFPYCQALAADQLKNYEQTKDWTKVEVFEYTGECCDGYDPCSLDETLRIGCNGPYVPGEKPPKKGDGDWCPLWDYCEQGKNYDLADPPEVCAPYYPRRYRDWSVVGIVDTCDYFFQNTEDGFS